MSLISLKKKSKGKEEPPAELAPPAEAAKDTEKKGDAKDTEKKGDAKDEKKGDTKEEKKDDAKSEKKDDSKDEKKKELTPEEKDKQQEAIDKLKDAEEAVRIARFKEIAKTKVADLIKKHVDLDKNLKEQYTNLEKIL